MRLRGNVGRKLGRSEVAKDIARRDNETGYTGGD